MADQRRWLQFGKELHHYRMTAGMTQGAVANALHVAAPSVSAYERGTRKPPRAHAESLDKVLSAGGALVQKWDDVNEIREIPSEWREFDKIERQAQEIREYQPILVPGLLQTTEYAQALLQNSGVWEDSRIREIVELRTKRLAAVEARLIFAIDEFAVRRVIGSAQIMRSQLDSMIELCRERRIRMSILPNYTPQHPAPIGPFRIMTLSGGRLVAHEEFISGVSVVTGPQISTLASVFGSLQAEALPSAASIRMLESIRKEINDDK